MSQLETEMLITNPSAAATDVAAAAAHCMPQRQVKKQSFNSPNRWRCSSTNCALVVRAALVDARLRLTIVCAKRLIVLELRSQTAAAAAAAVALDT